MTIEDMKAKRAARRAIPRADAATSFAQPVKDMWGKLEKWGLVNSPNAPFEVLKRPDATMRDKLNAMSNLMFVGNIGKLSGLDLSTAARMGRAEKMGMSADAYHGRVDDFPAFSGPTWVANDPRTASYYSERARAKDVLSNSDEFELPDVDELNPHDVRPEDFGVHPDDVGAANVMPLKINKGKNLDLTHLGDAPDPKDLWDHLAEKGIVERVDDETFENDILPELTTDRPTLWKAIEDWGLDRDIGKAGYDSVTIQDIVANKQGTENHEATLIFDPKNIRSRFAEFDPEKAGESDLNYAKGGPVRRAGARARIRAGLK